jgi:hypothetical protein
MCPSTSDPAADPPEGSWKDLVAKAVGLLARDRHDQVIDDGPRTVRLCGCGATMRWGLWRWRGWESDLDLDWECEWNLLRTFCFEPSRQSK